MIGFYSWYSVDSKIQYPWLSEIRDHVDPLLRTPKKQDHMALRQFMKRVYEKSLNGLWISTGTYYLFPSQSDKLETLRKVAEDKDGIDLHYVEVYQNPLQKGYILDKYIHYLQSLVDNDFEKLVCDFKLQKKAYILHKIESLIFRVENIEKELETIELGLLSYYSNKMKKNLEETMKEIES